MHKIVPTTQFKKDLKLIKEQGKDTSELNDVINTLAAGKTLSEKYQDHLLSGNRRNHRE